MNRRDLLVSAIGLASGMTAVNALSAKKVISPKNQHADSPAAVIYVDKEPYNGDLKSALINAIPGCVIVLGNRTYDITGLYVNNSNTIENIKIFGAGGRPKVSGDKSQLINGSVIQGAIKNAAKGMQLIDVGIDCGNYVSQNLYSPVTYEDGFQCFGVGDNAGIHLDNIITLGSIGVESNDSTHGILLERLSGVTFTYVECVGGYHGFTVKGRDICGDRIWSYGQSGEAVIWRSDEMTKSDNFTVNQIRIGKDGYNTRGVVMDSNKNNVTENINIGFISAHKCDFVLWPATPTPGNEAPLKNVHIGFIQATECISPHEQEEWAVSINDNADGFSIGSLSIDGARGGIRTGQSCKNVVIDTMLIRNSITHGCALGGDITHGKIRVDDNKGHGVLNIGGFSFDASQVTGRGNKESLVSSAVAVSSITNGWEQGKDGDFRAIKLGRTCRISGTLSTSNASSPVAVTFINGIKADMKTSISAIGFIGRKGWVPLECFITTDGELFVSGYKDATKKVIQFNGEFLIEE